MEEEEVSDVITTTTNNNNTKSHIQGVTLGESNTDTGSCDSLLEIVNYLDSEDYSFNGNFDNSVAKSESAVTVGDVSTKNVDMPVIPNEKGVKRSSSVRSDVSDHIISQFLDRSVDDVGFVAFVIAGMWKHEMLISVAFLSKMPICCDDGYFATLFVRNLL